MTKVKVTLERKPSWEKRISVNSAKTLAKRYYLGAYKGYCKMDGYFYFEDGRVGDCTPGRTGLTQIFKRWAITRDVEINLNDKNLKFVKY